MSGSPPSADDEDDDDADEAPPRRLPGLFPPQAPPLSERLRGLASRVAGELLARPVGGWAPTVGARLGRWELVAPLGRGGQGEVWRARDEGGVGCAIKLLARGATDDPRLVERFGREVRLLASLTHPGLVRVHEVGVAPDGRPFFAMELVPEARTLTDALREGLPTDRALDAVEELLEALAAVHGANLVHRDIKPGNVLLSGDGPARLVDFGLARGLAGEARLTSTGEVWGTPGYVAPEQLQGDPARLGPWCDVYAVGALLHLILAGFAPQARPGELARTALPPDVPAPLAALVERAMHPLAERRPPDAAALLLALREARHPAPRPAASIRLLAGVALCALTALITLQGLRWAKPPLTVAPPPAATDGASVVDSADPAPSGSREAGLPEGLTAGPEPGVAICGRDGSRLRWIPTGVVRLGSEDGGADERPRRSVTLEGFWLGERELDWGRFRRFCAATGRTPPPAEIEGEPPFRASDAHPVFGVTLAEARAYCDWAGLRLPREAEWEWAARGPEGRRFPWGEQLPRDGTRVANLADRTARAAAPPGFGRCEEDYDDGAFWPTPVGSYPAGASPFGCLDMAGNVWEWTEDPYLPYDDLSAEPGPLQATRGGSWDNPLSFCRASNRGRMPSSTRANYLGFRVAR